jgi:hypothetical protein
MFICGVSLSSCTIHTVLYGRRIVFYKMKRPMRCLSRVSSASVGLQQRHGDSNFQLLVLVEFYLLTVRFGGYVLNAVNFVILWEYIFDV